MKNCLTCVYMTYEYGDINDSEGYVCTRKDFSEPREERKMLRQMKDDKYLNRYKRCYTENKPMTKTNKAGG